MTIPAIVYRADVPGTPQQAVTNSEWAECAAVSALAWARAGHSLSGATGGDGKAVLEQWLETKDIPVARARLWANAINGASHVLPAALPPGLPIEPDPYQRVAAGHMSVGGGTLAFRCGLGKTITAVLWANTVGYTNRCWIVAPINAFGAWQRYLPGLQQHFAEVRIVSVDMLHKLAPACPSTGGVLIFDEAHKLGGIRARRTKHAMALRLRFDVALCLTATLTHAGIVRVLPVLQLAVPGMASFANTWKAADYFSCIDRNKFGSTITLPEGKHHANFLDFLARRRVVSLGYGSPSVVASVAVPDQDLTIVSTGDMGRDTSMLATGYVRRKIESGVGIPTAQEVAHFLCREGAEAKVAWVIQRLESKEPWVVFARYQETLDLIEEAFKDGEITYVRVDGHTNSRPIERAAAVAAFQGGEVQVFLGQIDAAGVSADLFRANQSVALDHSWQPESYDQALGRTRRRGQQHRCAHYDLVANKLQAVVVGRLRDGRAFDASVTEYQDIRRACTTTIMTPDSLSSSSSSS